MTDLIEILKTPLGAGVVGITLFAIGAQFVELGLSAKVKTLFKVLGVAFLGFAFLTYSGIDLLAQNPTEPGSTISSFEVTGSESHSYVQVNNEANSFTWSTAYNYGSDSITGASQATFTFAISRGIGNVGLVQTSADVVSVPDVLNGTTGLSSPVISKSGDQYNAVWSRPDGTTGIDQIAVTIAESSDGVVLTLNLTLGAGAVKNMAQYEVQNISLDVAGTPWTIGILKTSV